MKHLLITGFDPFGGETVNPAWEAVSRLPDTIGGFRLTKLQIPTVFGIAADAVLAAARADAPDVILCVGMAAGRDAVTPERIAINMASAKKPDNAGNQPLEAPILPGGPDGMFSTVPVSAMADAITAAGLPGRVSNTAGTFVCNDTLYRLLHHYADTPVRVGFVHVPHLPQQAGDGAPSMPLGDMIAALTAAIGILR
ncbi:MAG: pyroglutamyl-peptidase I [Oscillospiraceae bacterium]|nr:pyroglutamyl-peptidase I [Oscillospiraceae bacterium]